MSHHIKGQLKTQATMFPEALDDLVTEDNPFRVIDVFVDSLDLVQLGFEKVTTMATGRPCYYPSTMLKLYIYGYLNRIQSLRQLEKETNRNVELMWLLELLQPNFKTIADFRKDNGEGINNTCQQFVQLCKEMKMFTDAVTAIDSIKFKAVNNKQKTYTPEKGKDLNARFDASITRCLDILADKNKQEISDEEVGVMHEKVGGMKMRLADLAEIEAKIQAALEKVSLTDTDSRLMKANNMTKQVCYNVQSAVDTKHHLIISHNVTQATDRGCCKKP